MGRARNRCGSLSGVVTATSVTMRVSRESDGGADYLIAAYTANAVLTTVQITTITISRRKALV